MRTWRLLPLALWLFALPAHADTPTAVVVPSAQVKVHDHLAYVFRAPLENRPPAQRAAAASANLSAVIDDDVPGELELVMHGDVAEVRVGSRMLFRLSETDAKLDGATSLAEYAPRIQTQLAGFLAKERRRAHLQRGVLGVSLAVFFAVLVWVLLRAFYRGLRAFEQRVEGGEELLPAKVRKLGLQEGASSRGTMLFAISAGRILVTVTAIYVLALVSLSLFETTRPFRDRLAGWAAAPFSALAHRLVVGLPNLLLLVVLLAVLRGGWRAMTLGFERMAVGEMRLLDPHQVIPMRLIARAALVVGALMLLPAVLGGDRGLFTAVGLALLVVIGVGTLPLLANVAVGVFALLTNQYPPGQWLVIRMPSGKQVDGEVTSVDFFHLRVVPELGGEVRIPHLLALLCAFDHLPPSRALTVDLPVPRSRFAPREALAALEAAAAKVAQQHKLSGAASIELHNLTAEAAHFRIALPEGHERARTELLMALEEATRGPGGAA